MKGQCGDCGSQEWRVESSRIVRFGVPQLTAVSQAAVDYACQVCGKVERSLSDGAISRPDISQGRETSHAEVEQKRALIHKMSPSGSLGPTIQYPAVSHVGDNVLFPTFEGNIQDGTVIGQYGKPDLMVEFAEEYLRQCWSVMPSGRLPNSLSEIMPALLLLVTASELSVKAYWIRSNKPIRTHDVPELYGKLDPEHRKDIEERFANSDMNSKLVALGVETPKVAEILAAYSQTYGRGSNVHMDSRYYAEPTTMFRSTDDLKGATLVKGGTPYPIFLPDVVRALIDTYRFYSGPERLRRLGADLQGDFRDSGNDNHGEWGLIPSSLGLVVVVVSQKAGKDAQYEDLKVFDDFRESHPTDFFVDWMYGGNTLLFYHDNGQGFPDGRRVIAGLECRVWSKERLGLHPRDLYLLADALECAGKGEDRFGHFTNQGAESPTA